MTKKITCAHCGTRATAEVLSRTTVTELLRMDTDPSDTIAFEVYFFLTKCSGCDAVQLLMNHEYNDDPEDLEEARVLYPQARTLSNGVPVAISREYAEAQKV